MKEFLRSIRFRVWLLFIGFVAAILLFLYLTQIVFLPQFYDFMKTGETRGTVEMLKTHWKDDGFIDTAQSLAQERQIGIKLYFCETDTTLPYSITFDMSSNSSFKKNNFFQDEMIMSQTVLSDSMVMTRFTEGGKQAILMATYIGDADAVEGYIFVTSYLEPVGTTAQILKTQFFFSAGIVLLTAFLLSAFVVSRISRPMVKIAKSAQKLTTGEFHMEPKKSDYSEITTLTQNLNTASEEIAKTDTLRKDLMANISHDLKTPLTMIKAYAEMIRDLSGDNPEKREKHLGVIIDETDRLNSLVMDILDLSKIQSGVNKLTIEEFSISERLETVSQRFAYLKEQQDYNITTEIDPDIYIKGDVQRLEQVLYNLIGNAVNYTGEDKTVSVRLIFSPAAKTVRFEVSDSGVGIAPEALPYIWDRYYKVNRSENHQRAVIGTGLGLSIVKGVLESHAYRYGVDSTVGKGTKFWFECAAEQRITEE